MNLTPQEIAVCHATGIAPSEFLATRETLKLALSAELLRNTRILQQEISVCSASGTFGLSEQEIAVCHATGVTPAQFAAAKFAAMPSAADATPARAGRRASHSTGLSDYELAVCDAAGVSPEAFAAAKGCAAMPLKPAANLTLDRVGVALAACAFTVPALNGSDLIDIQLTPAGDFKPSDGREMKVPTWRINKEIAARVIARFNARANPGVIDYEHQTLHKEANGQPAPAAAWMRSLEWREGSGLWAKVELTARAAELIRNGEYKFISPVFAFDSSTGEVLSIRMAAFTNDPAIDGMEPLQLRAAATFGRIAIY